MPQALLALGAGGATAASSGASAAAAGSSGVGLAGAAKAMSALGAGGSGLQAMAAPAMSSAAPGIAGIAQGVAKGVATKGAAGGGWMNQLANFFDSTTGQFNPANALPEGKVKSFAQDAQRLSAVAPQRPDLPTDPIAQQILGRIFGNG